MKRLRSSDDLDSFGEKTVAKDSSSNPSRSSSSHRSFYYKSENARKGLPNSSSTSSFRYDRDRSVGDDDSRENPRPIRKRSEHEFDSFDRRKGFDRYRDGYSGDRTGMHRSESFSGPRREFPKGFRSERDRSRREGSVSSWRRFGVKEFEESGRGGNSGSSRGGLEIAKNSNLNSPKNALRDVKSPTWSKDSNSEQSRVKLSPSRGLGDRKSVSKSRSPTWSKDSESEQSKSVEVKKSEELQVESGSSSEMEEGELEPEPESETGAELGPEAGAENEAKQDTGLDSDVKEVENVNAVAEREEGEKASKESVSERKDVGEKVGELSNCQNDSIDEVECAANDKAGKEEENLRESRGCNEEVNKGVVDEKSLNLEEECKEDKGIDLEVKVEDVELPEVNNEVEEENGGTEVSSAPVVEGLTQNFKDKGKSVAVTLTHGAESAEDGVWIERQSREVVTSRDNDMEGPSTRGFELFSSSPVRKREKTEQTGADSQKDEKLGMESLDLSLSLPNVLLPIGARDSTAAPGSPSHGRSGQSFSTFRTNSDGFTASMSFSGSQSFYHNPSCSLTQNSMDNYEQSVGSRPIFQGIDQGAWQGQSQNESKHKEVPLYQRILMNGNGSLHQPQALQGVSNGQAVQGQHFRAAEGSSKMPNGLERQLSFQKQLSGGHPRHHDDVRSPSQSVGSHEIGSNYSFDKKRIMREKHGGNLYRSSSMKEEQLMIGGADFVESIITRIVSEQIHVMARKFHEMTGQSMACLKESIREIMLNADKYGQLSVFQKVLQNRSDLTLEMLLKSHRAQLEILVALKTGLPDFLQQDNIASSDLAEIFLNLRCRNLTCRSLLPVDECDCKVCAQKNGFCSACMCLVCSKFDMASNTCSWVGCDVCLHWCHADCGLRESYIRNGRSATGAQGTTEMQFQCVACDHPSEMFGFVKEVFQNFAKEWTAETLSRELEYVKRIFSASKDLRGKRLHEIADQMLARLANKANLPEVYNYIMGFLTESDSSKFGNSPVFSGKEQGKVSNGIGGIGGPNEDTAWLKSVYSEKAPQLERTASILPSFNTDRNDKRPMESELHRTAPKEPLFDELESIVRIKQAEAKMFQTRADDARREAERLKRIAIAKNEKIEEEYTSRITKLRLVEAEEMRKQKLEELQSLERAHREYFNMKMRMEADIKDLLLKMEATKRNLAM